MKWSGYLSASLLPLLALPVTARAAGPAADEPDPRNPYAEFDPDGAPLVVTQSPKHPLTAAQIEALKQVAAAQERNRNWLMLEYEHQLKLHSGDVKDQSKASNLYLQLSMNKDLAQLAGVQTLDADGTTSSPDDLHVAPSPSTGKTTLRAEAPAAKAVFTPLISPLSSPSLLASQPFYTTALSSNIPSILAPSTAATPANPEPGPTQTAASTPSPAPASYTETTDLQTPGMTAASKGDSLEDAGTPDLSLDSLPTQAQAEAREEGATKAELPEAMTVDTLHRAQAVQLAPPVPLAVAQAKVAQKNAAQQKQQQAQVTPAPAPMPIMQQLQLSPVHAPNANPYDFLNH